MAELPNAYPLAGAVVRDAGGTVIGATIPADGLRPVPQAVLEADGLFPVSSAAGRRASWDPLPEEGGRIPLSAGAQPIGWLDVWGDGMPTSAASRRALSDFARALALLLAAERSAHT
jgi:hypothetical protein